jgi:hypothetical protein
MKYSKYPTNFVSILLSCTNDSTKRWQQHTGSFHFGDIFLKPFIRITTWFFLQKSPFHEFIDCKTKSEDIYYKLSIEHFGNDVNKIKNS